VQSPDRPRAHAPAVLAALALSLLVSLPAAADGGVHLGTSTLLSSGDPANKIDLVFLGDGFTADQQGRFNSRVDEAVREFLAAHPILAARSAFNVHRVNVSSPESGTDSFSTCDGASTGRADRMVRTALDSGYCNGGGGSVDRCMGTSDFALARGFAALAPDDDITIVLVNDGGHGGCAFGDITFFTLTDDFAGIVVHELGHAIFDLADEYNYDGPDRFTGGEPGRANITIATDRRTLKWGDLVLGSTPIPTQRQNDCSSTSLPSRNVDADLVGTFEGASYSRCDIYRPWYTCRMRASNQRFCPVCRRQILRTLAPFLSSELGVTFDNLLIRDDSEGWPRGDGEIYLHYELRSNGQQLAGRWPASGESGFDDGDSKDVDFFAGLIPRPATGTTAAVDLRVRENDWPDGDDTLSSPATEPLPASGNFTVDRSDYRLRGHVEATSLRVLLDTLHVKNDHDGFFTGDGDIFVRYTISNGSQQVTGRWPAGGERSIGSGESTEMAVLAAALPRPASGDGLSVRLVVRDDDLFGSDLLGDDTFLFTSAGDFGADAVVHVRDRGDYRVTLSVVAGP